MIVEDAEGSSQLDGETSLTFEEIKDIPKCKSPYSKIGLRCCISDIDIPNMCSDEAVIFENKLTESVEEGHFSKSEMINDERYGISFTSPPDYYAIKDLKKGGLPFPYGYYYFYADDLDKYIQIEIGILEQIFEELGIDYSEVKENYMDNFEEGLSEGFEKFDEVFGSSFNIEDGKLITTKTGKEAFVIERVGTLDSQEVHQKIVIFLDRYIMLSFSATSGYAGYVEEFDELVDSFDFEQEVEK